MEQLMLIPIDKKTVKPLNHLVTKANALVEANYRLSLVQQKIVIILASMVQPGDDELKWYRLNLKHFTEILCKNNHDYREMVMSVHNLMERVVTIFIGGDEYLKTHWVQTAKYKVGGGYVDVRLDPELKPFFLHLKEKFTTYRLNNVAQLKSAYSIRIYELLKQYQSIGKRTLSLESLRNMMGITPKEYHLYGDFKRFVILVAYKEINEKTDIAFEFREIKLGRKVDEIEFIINRKETESKSEKLKRREDARKQKQEAQENKEKTLLRQRIDDYLAQLSSEEQEALTAEAEALAREEGSAFMKERKIPEPVLNGYRLEIVKKRLAL